MTRQEDGERLFAPSHYMLNGLYPQRVPSMLVWTTCASWTRSTKNCVTVETNPTGIEYNVCEGAAAGSSETNPAHMVTWS